jgi:hypothetical protein
MKLSQESGCDLIKNKINKKLERKKEFLGATGSCFWNESTHKCIGVNTL